MLLLQMHESKIEKICTRRQLEIALKPLASTPSGASPKIYIPCCNLIRQWLRVCVEQAKLLELQNGEQSGLAREK